MRARLWTSLVFVFLAGTLFGLEPAPTLLAKSALLMDERSGKILYVKNADTVRFPASTTKIMTALLLLERCRPDEMIIAPKDVEKVPPSSLHLKPGEAVSAQDMLHALLIRSANDAAYAVAVHIGGSEKGFAKLMNERAKAIGCTSTNFNNPHGLNDPKHTSTARDLALMAREAMKNPEFRKVANTRVHVISRSINQDDLWLTSKNKILKYDVTADGVKTGYTRPAGHCYVGSATRNGFRFITVILGSTKEWTADHKALMNWAFKNYTRTCLEQPGEVLRGVSIGDGPSRPIQAKVNEPVFYAHAKSETPELITEIRAKPGLAFPVRQDEEVGTITFRDGKGWSFSTPLLAAEDVEEPRFLQMGSMAPLGPAGVIFACLLGGGALWMRRRARTMF